MFGRIHWWNHLVLCFCCYYGKVFDHWWNLITNYRSVQIFFFPWFITGKLHVPKNLSVSSRFSNLLTYLIIHLLKKNLSYSSLSNFLILNVVYLNLLVPITSGFLTCFWFPRLLLCLLYYVFVFCFICSLTFPSIFYFFLVSWV